MAFEPRMHLGQKLAQVQVMSPQMQQSLAFLQAPMLDLQGMVNKELQETRYWRRCRWRIKNRRILRARGNSSARRIKMKPPNRPATPRWIQPMNRGTLFDDFQAEMERLAELSEEWRDPNASKPPPWRCSVRRRGAARFYFRFPDGPRYVVRPSLGTGAHERSG